MNIDTWLKNATQKLQKADISSAKLDAEVLLADALGKDRSWIHAHPDFSIPGPGLGNLQQLIERRCRHEPIAYIRGKQEFYGREFKVSPNTLTPRPETETMLELLFKQIEDGRLKIEESTTIIDVGTGSGCIIITAALELSSIPNLQSPISYVGLDISKKALKIARLNAKNLGTSIDFEHFDLVTQPLTPYLSPYTVILANLPYVPTDFHINLAASHEPKFAIYGGEDGLDYYRALFSKFNRNTKYVLTESMPPQHKGLAEIAEKHGYKLQKTQDLIQVFYRK